MKNPLSVCVFFSFLIVLIQVSFAQDSITIKMGEGIGSYCVSNDITPNQAKQKAILLAKKNAIENAFGTTVQATQRLQRSSDRNETTKKEDIQEFFSSLINEELKGEFVQVPSVFCEEKTTDNQLCFQCKVQGKMFATNDGLKKSFEFATLNRANKLATKNDFTEGESLYLHFKSSIKGHLAVFFIANKTAYKILPYQNSNDNYFQNNMPIEADKEYIFFDPIDSKKNYPQLPKEFVDELNLSLDHPQDTKNINNVVVVFSKTDFDKPILSKTKDNAIPPVLTEADFYEWLLQNKLNHKDFVSQESIITIQKNNR